MSRGGLGSATIVLVFAVLCLSIFTVISFMPALIEQNLITTEVELVEAYFEADVLAERVVAEILDEVLAFNGTPEYVMGIGISSFMNFDTFEYIIYFQVPVADTHLLYIELSVLGDEYQILKWRLYNIIDWVPDDSLPVWQGDFDSILSGF